MKRTISLILAVILLLSLLLTIVPAAYAAGNARNKCTPEAVCDNRTDCAFTDTDQDGICDNRAIADTGKNCDHDPDCGFADADGDGICDNQGKHFSEENKACGNRRSDCESRRETNRGHHGGHHGRR